MHGWLTVVEEEEEVATIAVAAVAAATFPVFAAWKIFCAAAECTADDARAMEMSLMSMIDDTLFK